jgi:predicted phage terminase large subunit-like protein
MTTGDLSSRAADVVSAARRIAAEQSLEVFARLYLGRYIREEPSRMHRELYALLEGATSRRGARIAVAAPRGHAKSTIASCAYVLWCICFRHESYIVILSESADQARDQLSHVKQELESNELLLRDFPEACEPPNIKPVAERWRREEIVTRNGIKVTALGAQSRIRGRKNRQDRPSLIVLDDLENEGSVISEEQRIKLRTWFHQAVAQAGTEQTNIVVVGTVLHYDSLLCNLLNPDKSPGWTTRRYQAVETWSDRPELWEKFANIYQNQEEVLGLSGPEAAYTFYASNKDAMLEGTRVLWPQREDYVQLMVLRIRDGRIAFDKEKQNVPINPEDCYFRQDEIRYWDDEYKTVEDLIAKHGKHLRVCGACDPSLGKAGRHADDTAIVTLLLHTKTKVMYVVDADIRRLKPDAIVERIIEYHRIRNYSRFIIEANQFQEILVTHLRRRSTELGCSVPVHGHNNFADKMARIQKLQPLVASGMLLFSKRHRLLLEQLFQFPHGAHDDGPDALEMAVTEVTRPGPSIHTFFCNDDDWDDPRRVTTYTFNI